MSKYTTTGNGVKLHMKAIKEIYLVDGESRVKYKKKESSFAPHKTSCGRYDDRHEAVNIMDFIKRKKQGEDVCQVCLTRAIYFIEEGKKQRERNHV